VRRVVCVHGVGQQHEVTSTLHQQWASALCGGVQLAGGQLAQDEVCCVAYGDLFRPRGRPLTVGDSLIRAESLDTYERELLALWWTHAAQCDPEVIAPDARSLARTPRGVQAALRALSGSRFFAGVGERMLLGNLRQVLDYFHKPEIRQEARRRVADVVSADTRVLVGHSLGYVVAYEALCANPDWPVRMLVTLGSPLGIANLIFDRLQPTPRPPGAEDPGPRGHWPGNGREWNNIADEADVVAVVKDLRPLFGVRVRGWVVNNGARAHAVKPYLTAVETGRAVLMGLGKE
jgi:pimeloyl-ACP methyl ester carboxylesterase